MKFKCVNTHCSNCDMEISFTTVKVKVIDEEIQYHSNGKRIVCKNCGEVLEEIKDEEKVGFGKFYCAFSGKTPQEKREILKKREQHYQKRDKVFREYRDFKDNGGKD